MKLFGYTIIATKQLDKTLSEFALLKKSLRQHINDWVVDWQLIDPNFYSIELDESSSRWKVLMYNVRNYQHECVLIKSFYFSPNDEDDKAYALRCAEELIDKLEEKI